MGRSPLLRFLLGHAAVGAAVAVTLVAVMLAADVARLRSLVFASDAGMLALAVMTAFFVITFASVQMGMALMLRSEDGGPRRRSMRFQIAPSRALRPVPVRSRPRR